MRFLADMGVDQRIVRWLQQNGDDAIHLRDEGLQRLPDFKIVDKAHSESRVILTFDLDFGEITATAQYPDSTCDRAAWFSSDFSRQLRPSS